MKKFVVLVTLIMFVATFNVALAKSSKGKGYGQNPGSGNSGQGVGNTGPGNQGNDKGNGNAGGNKDNGGSGGNGNCGGGGDDNNGGGNGGGNAGEKSEGSQIHDYPGNVDDYCYKPVGELMKKWCEEVNR